MSKMKPEYKERWLAALRSNKYTQARGTLREHFVASGESVESFCCLGVLCDIVKDELGAKWEDGKLDGCCGTLPDHVKNLVGLDSDNPVVLGNSTLTHLNDDERYDFKQIADIIEERL